MSDHRHSPQWDWKASRSNVMAFRSDAGEMARDAVKVRALAALTEAEHNAAVDVDGPLWALVDLSGQNARVIDAASWYRVAAAYSEDDELRADRCRAAACMLRRAFRLYA